MATSLKDDINPFSKAHFSLDPLGLLGGHKKKAPPKEPTLPTEADYASSLAQRPVPYFAGRRRIPLSWVTDVFDIESVNTPSTTGGKGGGSSKKGGGNSQKTYYCSIAGIVALGPADYVLQMEADNDMVNPTWTGTHARSGDYVDLTPSDIDYGAGPDLMSGGRIRLYWGTETQTVDPILTGHPNYAGYTYLVLKRFLMGASRGTPRDINLTLARLPAVDTSIVASGSNTFSTDGSYQVNPIAVMAEIFLSPWGLGWDPSMLDATSWLAESAYAWGNQIYTECSCFFDSIELARNKLPDLMGMADVALRWLPNGKLGLAHVQPGYVPGNAATFDATQFRDGSQLRPKSQGLSGLATKVQVDFYNSEMANYPIAWKNDNVQASDMWALQTMGYVPNTLKVSRPFVCGVQQAMLHGQEALRRQSVPALSGVAHLRSAEIAVDTAGAPIQPGDKHYFDIDPVPGGTATDALATVTGRTDFADGTVDLDLMFDPMQPVTLTLPAWTGGIVRPTPTAASMLYALIVPQLTSDNHAAAWILATRPDTSIHGFKAFFGATGTGPFVELGNQGGFACRASLVSDLSSFATTLRFNIVDGDSGPDGYIAGMTPENTEAAEGDQLLAILCYVDSNGAILVSGYLPAMEFVSLVSRTAVSTNVYDYTILRGRNSTAAYAWSHTSTVCWIVPKANLTKWTTAIMDSEAGSGDTNWCPLASFTTGAEDATIPLPKFAVKFPELTGGIDGGGNYEDYFRVVTGGSSTIKCKDRSGTASLIGCPSFASIATPPKRWRRTEYSGSHGSASFDDSGCTTPSTGFPPVTCVPTYWRQLDRVTAAATTGGDNVCNGTPLGGSIGGCVSVPSNACHETYSATETVVTSAPTTSCCATGTTPAYLKNYGGGSIAITLSDEDTEADALARLVATFTDWASLTWTACTMLPCCSSTRAKRGPTDTSFAYGDAMVQITVTGLVVVEAYVVLRVEIWRTDLDTMTDEPGVTNDYEATVDMSGNATWEFLLPNEEGYTYFVKSYKFLGFTSL